MLGFVRARKAWPVGRSLMGAGRNTGHGDGDGYRFQGSVSGEVGQGSSSDPLVDLAGDIHHTVASGHHAAHLDVPSRAVRSTLGTNACLRGCGRGERLWKNGPD